MAAQIQPAFTESVRDFLERLPHGRLLLFAHPGYEPSVRLLQVLREEYPQIEVTLLTHITLTKAQQETLPVREIITFDKRVRNRMTDLARMAVSKISELRQRRFDGLLLWYRGFEHSPDLLLLETFAAIAGTREALFWDDTSGRTREQSNLRLFAIRWPWTVVKVLLATLLMLTLWLIVRLRLAFPQRPWRRVKRRGGLTVAFMRTDLELALSPMDIGGSVSHVKGVVEGLVAAGNRVISYAPAPLAGVDPERVPARMLRTPLFADLPREVLEALAGLSFAWQGCRLLKEDRVDLIYQRYSMNNMAGVLVAQWLGVPLLLEANNSEVVMRRQFSRLTFARLAAALERYILQTADAVVTVSERNRDTFASMGIPTGHITVVPNAVNPSMFSPERGDGGLREELGLKDQIVVGFAGLFYSWHGVSYLAKAFVQASAVCPNAHLLLVGDGDEREVVRGILLEAGLGHRTTFTGMVPHERVPLLMQACDILVASHAPWTEFFGSPIKLFEYMSSGKAVVASNVGQIAQVIQDGLNGLLYPAGDVDALARALVRLCQEPDMRTRLGTAARQDVLSTYTWEKAARKSLGLITGEVRKA